MFSELSSYLPYVLGVAFLAASALYASVGHGGASAYLAVMGLCGMAPVEMKPIALVLNIAVSTVALIHFARAGHFHSRLFWPLVLASVPAAFLGGWLQSPDAVLKSSSPPRSLLAHGGCWSQLPNPVNQSVTPAGPPCSRSEAASGFSPGSSALAAEFSSHLCW